MKLKIFKFLKKSRSAQATEYENWDCYKPSKGQKFILHFNDPKNHVILQ